MASIPTPEVLAYNVQRELDARGWTQVKLAAESKLPQPRISEILRGKIDHRLGTVEKLADAFGITVSALLMLPAEWPSRKKTTAVA